MSPLILLYSAGPCLNVTRIFCSFSPTFGSIRKYFAKKGNIDVYIDKKLENIRPFIVCAVIKGVKVDENFIIQMVQLQEKVGETFGRKRREAGIGLYDLDVMKPPIYYKGFKDNEIEYIPLDWKVPMRPSEILTQDEKGKGYAHLLEKVKFYPIVIDSNKVVASMPPIINSEATGRITKKTKNIFIEVTGFKLDVIETALEVMCMSLVDRGGKLFSTKIHFPKGKIYPKKPLNTPQFKTQSLTFEKSLIEKKAGMKFSDKQIKSLLERARYNVKVGSSKVTVEFPSYRRDILHAVDVIEDLLISYGYNNLVPQDIEMSVTGSQLPETLNYKFIREGCIGLGLQEVLTFNLTSKQIQESKLSLKEDFVQISNPVSSNYEVLRKRLTPQLLNFLSKNKTEPFPQKIFEIGTCLDLNPKAINKVSETTNLCILLSSSNVDFTLIKSVLVSICQYMGATLKVKKKDYSFLEKGAEITVNGKTGFIGEINKKTSEAFSLKKPAVVLEFPL